MEGMQADPYKVLGLHSDASPEEIKKTYRKLVLVKHPDKQPGNKHAQEEFIQIKRAYELLTDDKAKDAWQALQRAKEAREAQFSQQNAKRRKMAKDLYERESEHAKRQEETQRQEKAATNKLKEELARLKRQVMEREQKEKHELAAKLLREQHLRQFSNSVSSSEQHKDDEAHRTLKLAWDIESGDYSLDQLREIFSTHGGVEEVMHRESKKNKKKGKRNALVVMTDSQGFRAALQAANGEAENPILVVPLLKEMAQDVNLEPDSSKSGFNHPRSATNNTGGQSNGGNLEKVQEGFTQNGNIGSHLNIRQNYPQISKPGQSLFPSFGRTTPTNPNSGSSLQSQGNNFGQKAPSSSESDIKRREEELFERIRRHSANKGN